MTIRTLGKKEIDEIQAFEDYWNNLCKHRQDWRALWAARGETARRDKCATHKDIWNVFSTCMREAASSVLTESGHVTKEKTPANRTLPSLSHSFPPIHHFLLVSCGSRLFCHIVSRGRRDILGSAATALVRQHRRLLRPPAERSGATLPTSLCVSFHNLGLSGVIKTLVCEVFMHDMPDMFFFF